MGRVILQSLQQLQQQQSPRSVSPSAKKVLDFADSPSPNYETMGYYEILQKNRLSQNQQQQPRLVNPVHSSLPVEETNSQPLCPLPPSSPALLMSERDSTSLTQPFPAYTATPAIQHQVATTVEEISSSTTAAELALSSKQDQVNVANSSTSPPPSSSAPLSSTKKDGVVENVQELSATPDESIVEFLRSLSQTTSHEPIYSQKERFIFKKPYMFDRTSFLYRTILGGAVDEENSAYLETGPSSLSLSAATPHTNEPPILAEHDSFDYSQIPRHNFDMNPVAVIDSFSQTEPVKVLTAEEQEAELVRIAFEKEQATALALAEASAIAAAEAVAKNALLEAEALAAAEEADLLRKSKSSTTRKKSIAHSRRSSTVSGGLMPPDSVGSAAGTGDLLEVGGGFGHQHARRVSYTGGGASAPGSSIVGYRRMSSVSQASKPSYAVTTADQAVTTTVCNTKRPSTVSFSNQRRQLTSIATVELTKNVLVTEPLSSSPPPSLSSPTASTSTSPSMLPVSSITTAAAQTGGVKEAPVTQEDGLVFNARSESPSHSEMVAVHAVLDSYLSVESPHRTAVSPSATEQRNSLLQIASTSSNSSSSPLPPLPLLPPSSADETSSATLLTLINEHSSEAKPPVMMSQAVPTQQMEEPMLSIDSNEAEIGGKETSNSGSFSQPIITTPIIDKEEIKVEKAVDTPPAIDAGEKKLDAVVAMATGTTSIVNFSSSITEIGQTLPALAVTPQPQEDSATLASQATLNVATIKEKQSKLSQDTIDMLTRRLAGLESELKVVDTLIENIKL